MQVKSTSIGQRPTWAEINLNNLAHNFRVIKAAVGSEVAIMPAVKADAYGHGAVECARVLETEGAAWFAVALPEEGVELREAGIAKPILSLGGFWEGQEDFIIKHHITPVMFRLDLLDRLNSAAGQAGMVFNYHIKVDTGLGRLGVPYDEFANFLDKAKGFQNLRLDGAMTHCASADAADGGQVTEHQVELFDNSLSAIHERGFHPRWIHAANSGAAHGFPEARYNLVRLGGVLWGIWRDLTRSDVAPLDWRPVMSLHSQIILLKTVPAGTPLGYGGTFTTQRESRIATLVIGYEDGLPRALSNVG